MPRSFLSLVDIMVLYPLGSTTITYRAGTTRHYTAVAYVYDRDGDVGIKLLGTEDRFVYLLFADDGTPISAAAPYTIIGDE